MTATSDPRITTAAGPGWELHRRAPIPALAPVLADLEGYRERAGAFGPRREPAVSVAVWVLNLAGHFRVHDPRERADVSPALGFLAGPNDSWVDVATLGPVETLQVNFTLPGARRFLGLPLAEVANSTVDVEALFGPAGRVLVERLAVLPDWAARFDLIESFVGRRVGGAPGLPPEVAEAWRLLQASGGRASIAGVATTVGVSRQHLSATMTQQLGLPPKRLAEIVRFERALEATNAATRPRWSLIAAGAGYADQSHLTRTFQRFAGMSPGAFLARRDADGAGVQAG